MLLGLPIALNADIVQSGAVHGGANGIVIRRLGKLHIDQRAAAEIHALRNAVPEQHGEQPATLKTSEKARKYHFLPRKSMFGLRKNSTA